MQVFKNITSKFLLIVLGFLLVFVVAGCDKEEIKIEVELTSATITKGEEVTLIVNLTGTEDPTYTISFSEEDLLRIDGQNIITTLVEPANDVEVVITVKANTDEEVSDSVTLTIKADLTPPIIPDPEIAVGIKGTSEIRSGQSVNLKAEVTGTEETEVNWEIKSGSEYAEINDKGKLTAKSVAGDKIIEVIARSKADEKAFASKIITIVAKPELTQAMLDQLNVEKISFEGYININLYTIGMFSKLYRTFTTVVRTAMDGTNWYAEYESAAVGTKQGLYYKNHNNIASLVGVNFMNEEDYFPVLNDDDLPMTWVESGFYNNFVGLKVSDFKFNEETWRYEYKGNDDDLTERMVASANPYSFVPNNDGFALIIEEAEILGIYVKSMEDYTIASGYEAIQELIVAVNYNEHVEVPTIAKYSTEEIHHDLGIAIENMRALETYTLKFKESSASAYISGYIRKGFDQIVTMEDSYFKPFTFSLDGKGEEAYTYQENDAYGYHKIDENLYNTYVEEEGGKYRAVRAYESSFANARPTFAFAPEIFRTYYLDEEAGTTTYYVDDLMSGVASTFYHGVGNDIALYGIFATRGYTATSSFTPYVVVKEQMIVEAGFYYYLGAMYGVVEIEYANFDEAALPEELEIEFETRYVPTSWAELTIQVRDMETSFEGEVNALEYLIEFFDNENIAEIMPFFGVPLGDTYGFGLNTIRTPASSGRTTQAISFYYDVPLDINYTIESSIDKVEDYLTDIGFTKNRYGEFSRHGISVHVVDSNLDLFIYVWEA